MTKTMRYFGAAFVIGGILLGTLWGFALVDMSADTYMPGLFGPLFSIRRIDAEGVEVSFLGEEYSFETSYLDEAVELLFPYRGLAPTGPSLAREATLLLAREAENVRENGWPWE